MSSMILKKIAVGRKGKRGKGGSDLPPMDAPAAAADRGAANDQSAQEHTMQEAHDQVVEGLSTIQEKYPDAGDVLKQFEQSWTRWMSGHAGPQKGQGEGQPEPGPEGEVVDTSVTELQKKDDGLRSLARKFGNVQDQNQE